MNSVALSDGPIHLGLDVSKNKIAVGNARGAELTAVEADLAHWYTH